jgi:hypothetical protein
MLMRCSLEKRGDLRQHPVHDWWLQRINLAGMAGNRQTQAKFECVECSFEENADLVGAINILRAGHARFASEVSDAAGSAAAGTHRSDSGAAQCRA